MEEDSASMFPKKEREKPEEDEEATPPPSGGGWSGWGFSPFSVLSDLQKAATVAAEEISRNLPRLQQRALQICRMWPRTHKLLRRMIWKDLQLKEKTKMRMTSDVRLLWINWRRVVMIHSLARLEHSAVNLAESIQHGGLPAAGSVTLSLIESGIAITAKGMQVLELVGKETMDLLITETGINVENKEGQPQDDDDQFEEVTFDRCFYIYGGPEQLEELEALSNHYALLFNRRTGKLSSEQKSLYDGKLKLVRQIFSLGSEIDGSAIEAEKGKKIEVGVELGADEMKNLHDSSVSKAAEMAAGFANTLAGLPTNDIIQRTSGRLDSLHSEGVHRLSDMCCYATSQLMMLGKSIISNASKVQDTGVDEDALKIDWTEDSGEKAKIIRIRTQSMMGNVEAVCKSFMMGIAEVAEAYTAAVEDASVESQEVLPLKSIQEKANAFSENLRSDQTTATGKIQDGLQYLSYVVLSTSMPAA